MAHDPDAAHLRRIGNVRAPVGLEIEADYVDSAHLPDGGRQQVDLRNYLKY